jgi:signal transduction histidine kinase/CheY-like chemotaxis protein
MFLLKNNWQEIHLRLFRRRSCLRSGWSIALILALTSLSACKLQAPPNLVLTKVGQILSRNREQLKEGHPVSIKGIVTYYDRFRWMLIIQDESGGIPIAIKTPIEKLTRGSEVLIDGLTGYEGGTPIVINPQIKLLGLGKLPDPVPLSSSRLLARQQDMRLMLIECNTSTAGLTGSPSYDQFVLKAKVGAMEATIVGTVYTGGFFSKLLHQKIQVRGVPIITYTPGGDFHELYIYTETGDDFILPPESSPAPGITAGNPELKTLPPRSPITDIKTIKELSAEKADRKYPVRLQAVVINHNPTRLDVFLHDGKCGIYLESDANLQMGDRVEVRGVTGSGDFAPVIQEAKIRVLGRGQLPPLLHPDPSAPFRAEEENSWAELEGVVQFAESNPDNTTLLQLAIKQTSLTAFVQNLPLSNALSGLVDAQIRLRGVFGPLFNSDRKLTGYRMQIASPDYITIIKSPAGDRFDSPSRPIKTLLEYSPEGYPQHRVKISGVVTYSGIDRTIYLQDETGSLRVEAPDTQTLVTNSSIDVLGFLVNPQKQPVLRFTQIRPTEPKQSWTPTPMAVPIQYADRYDGKLVVMEAFLRNHRSFLGDHIFSFESGWKTFDATLEQAQSFIGEKDFREGALVQLTGICTVSWNNDLAQPAPTGFSILLRSADDIHIVKPAPWWTQDRAIIAAGSLLGILLLAFVWLYILRRQVAAQTSQLRQQMAEREALEEQLRQSQKLESVGRLAGGVAHDFNNLLTVINGYSELLLADVQGQPELLASVEEIQKAGERAKALTRQLLAFSRKQILRPVVLDLNELVGETDKMLRRLIGEDITLILHLSPVPAHVKVDPGQLTQVLLNLAANARDAMPEGGRLILGIDVLDLDASFVETHPEVNPGKYIRLTLSDTGTGMDEETQSHLFEPFFTTKGLGKGIGLGLATVFGIIKQSGGHIWVNSKPGHGSNFMIYIPQASGEAAPLEAQSAPTASGGSETILLVEDQEEVRQLILKALTTQGYRVLATANTTEAVGQAKSYTGPIHLLLTDVVMPGLNGKVLAEQMLQLRPGIRVLFMSGYAEAVIAHKGVLDADVEFISKPFSPALLSNRVREILGKKE